LDKSGRNAPIWVATNAKDIQHETTNRNRRTGGCESDRSMRLQQFKQRTNWIWKRVVIIRLCAGMIRVVVGLKYQEGYGKELEGIEEELKRVKGRAEKLGVRYDDEIR